MRTAETGRKTAGRLVLIAALLMALAAAVVWFLRCAPTATVAPEAAETPAPAATAPDAPGPEEAFDGLSVWFLDVGQGDCIFLRSPGGKTMLVDAGPAGSFGRIKRFLDRGGVERLDVVVATHLHADHIGSMSEVLAHYEVGAFYLSPFDIASSTYARMLEALEEAGVTAVPVYASAQSLLPWDEGCEVRVLSPYRVEYEDENDTSLMLRVSYQTSAVLLAGDAGQLAERLAVKALPGRYFHADVLKVGHHGSDSATGKKLLEKVHPRIAVLSVGRDNGYALPDERVLRRLSDAGAAVYRTDEMGTILVRLDGTGARVVN